MIQEKIATLSSITDTTALRDAMFELRLLILQNPEATSLLLDEDVGVIVQHLRKLTATAVQKTTAAPKAPAATAPKATASKAKTIDILAALDEF